ncbi:MAG: hypothetical protein ABSC03_10100 [Verrucomicrobiota bacterium]
MQAESAGLYKLLQEGVDTSIEETGYLPANGNGTGGSNGSASAPAAEQDRWNCSENQKSLVLKIVSENNLDKNEIETLAQEQFGKGVRRLQQARSLRSH